jgi:hypothetical protein
METREIDLPLKINPDPSLVYGYHDCLTRGVCLACGKSLDWKLEVRPNDDRFCAAVCCMTKYTMVPESVRITSSFALTLTAEEMEEAEKDDDDDFLKELQKM